MKVGDKLYTAQDYDRDVVFEAIVVSCSKDGDPLAYVFVKPYSDRIFRVEEHRHRLFTSKIDVLNELESNIIHKRDLILENIGEKLESIRKQKLEARDEE